MIAKRMPTFANWAKCRGESAYPHLWDELVYGWSPFLGPQPAVIKGRILNNSPLKTTYQQVDLNLTSGGWPDTSGNPIGTGPAFNGTTQFGQSSQTLDLTGTTRLTLCLWCKWTAFNNDDKLMMESSTNANSNANAITLNPNSSSALNFSVRINTNGAGQNAVKFTRPSAGIWHHYMIVMDRTLGAQQVSGVWVDGIPQTLTQTGTDTTSGTFGNYTWYMMSRAGSSLFGAGVLGDVWIYAHTMFGNKEAQMFFAGASPYTRNPLPAQANIMRRRFWSVPAATPNYDLIGQSQPYRETLQITSY
jgi:hypothetical protein